MFRHVLLFCTALLLAGMPATAGTVLYDNTGSLTGNTEAHQVNGGLADNFTITSSSTVTAIDLLLWYNGSAPTVSWGITTGGLSGTTLVSDSTTATVLSNVGSLHGYGMYWVEIATDFSLAAGTYWLDLYDAGSNDVYWDWSQGPSSSVEGISHTFKIIGDQATVPEPATWALAAFGIAAGLIRRSRR